eukprot:g2419.t1
MTDERSEFVCPISMTVMEDPVILVETAISYERREIETWFTQGNNTCPFTGLELKSQLLIPNRALKEAIANWNQQQLPSTSAPVSIEEPKTQKRCCFGLGWILNCWSVDSEEAVGVRRRKRRVVKQPTRDIASRITQAVQSDDKRALESLYDQGWSFNCLDFTGRGPLHIAVINYNPQLTTQLLQNFYVDVNFADRSGCTALHWASRLGHTPIVKFLINDFQANVNSNSLTKMTPLHMAAYWGKKEIVQFLIQNGASVHAVNHKLEKPIDVAHKSPWKTAKDVIPILNHSMCPK